MWKPALAILFALAIAACSSSGSSKTSSSTPAGGTVSQTLGTGTQTTIRSSPTIPGATVTGQSIDPCTLLTVDQASQLAGATLKKTSPGGPGTLDCAYKLGATAGTEVTVKSDADAATAHAEFPKWVQPFAGNNSGITTAPVTGVGDEATETHTGTVIDGIYFRKGDVLVKIGVYPPASSAALKTAATAALGKI